jgi:pimeloyl-ACP methyl ester carboxylesterase
LPGRTVSDYASDSAALIEALGADRYVTLGWSGGGPVALACAGGHPGRCLAAATVAGLMPYDSNEPACIEGMAEEDLDWLAMALRGAESLRPAMEAEAGPLRTISAEEVAASFEGAVGPADLVALRGEISEVLARSWNLGCITVDGWLDDLIASVNPWGFELSDIAVPVSIWHGDQDRIVPPSHARWLATHIPGADLHLLEGEGHISPVATPLPAILDDLLLKADL